MILSGMVNSVIMMRAHAALVLTLYHGSVWISLIAQVMILRCVFVMHDQDTTDEDVDTPIQLRCWNSISSSELHTVKLILTTHLKLDIHTQL